MNPDRFELTRYDLDVILAFYREAYNVALTYTSLSSTKQRSINRLVSLKLIEYNPEESNLCRLTDHGKEVIELTVETFKTVGARP